MSHVTTISVTIKDLAALKAAVKEFGCEWVEGKKKYTWFGQSVGDYPIPAGMTAEALGKCDHVIKVPGVNYEIGVVKLPQGGYTLAYDFYGNWGLHDGQKLLGKFGDGLKKLVQTYAVQVATMKAKASGWMTQRTTLPNGTIRLSMTGVQ